MHQQTENTKAQQLVPFHWKPGQSGNPKGRPKGARNKLADSFCADVLELWTQYGPGILKQAAMADPVRFACMVAGMIPKDHNLQIDAGPSFRALWDALANNKTLKPLPTEADGA